MTDFILTPIYQNAQEYNPSEKLGFLRFTTQFFDFGGKAYNIERFEHSPKLYLSERAEKPTWFNIAVRVILFFTAIYPTLMFVGALVYRVVNTFHSSPLTPLQKIGLDMLHDSLRILEKEGCDIDHQNKYIDIFKCLALFDEQEALEMARGINKVEPHLGVILTISDKNPVKALKMANVFFNSTKYKQLASIYTDACLEMKCHTLTHIATKLAETDPEKALDTVQLVLSLSNDPENQVPGLAKCLGSIAKYIKGDQRVDAVIELAKSIKNSECVAEGIHLISQSLSSSNPNMALKLSDIKNETTKKNDTLISVFKELALTNLPMAIYKAKDLKLDESVISVIAQAAACVNLNVALEYLSTIQDEKIKIEAFAGVAIAIISTNLEKALELAKSALDMTKSLDLESKLGTSGVFEKIIEFGAALPNQNLEIINYVLGLIKPMDNSILRDQSLLSIITKIAKSNPIAARDIANLIVDDVLQEEAFAIISKEMVLQDSDEAFEIADLIYTENIMIKSFIGLIEKAKTILNREKALEVINNVLDKARTSLDSMPILDFYLEAAKVLSIR